MYRRLYRWVVLGIIGTLTLIGCRSKGPAGASTADGASPARSTTLGLVQGRVTTPAGMPRAEVPVGAESLGNTMPVPALARLTDQDGRYTWQLPAGTYLLMVGTITKTVTIEAGQTVTLDIVEP